MIYIDNIFYIEQGKIIAQGNFETLTASNSQFKHIVKLSSLSSNKASDELTHAFN